MVCRVIPYICTHSRSGRMSKAMIKQEKMEPWAIRLVVKNEAVVEVKREHEDEDSEPWSNTPPPRNDGDDDSTVKRPTKQL